MALSGTQTTRLGVIAIPRQSYGSFAGKTAGAEPEAEVSKGMWPPVTKKKKKPVVQPLPEKQRNRVVSVSERFGPASIPVPRSPAERQAIDRALRADQALLGAASAIQREFQSVTREMAAERAAQKRAREAEDRDDEDALMAIIKAI